MRTTQDRLILDSISLFEFHIKGFLFLVLMLSGKISLSQQQTRDSLFRELKLDIEAQQHESNGVCLWDDDTKVIFYSYLKTCPKYALIESMKDSNAFIRAHLYLEYVRNANNTKLQKQILNKHINDTLRFTESNGDVTHTWKVFDYMKMAYAAKQTQKLKRLDYSKEIQKIRNKPRVMISGVRHGLVNKEDLLQLDSLSYSLSASKVISYRIDINSVTLHSESNQITELMKVEIKKLNARDKVYIYDIKVRGNDNIIRNIGSINLRVR